MEERFLFFLICAFYHLLSIYSQNSKAEKDKKVSQVDELESLKKKLNVAIQEERYEDAAKIRDKIKDIEKKNAK